ncbi:hypothetical protein 015DV002_40 [Bacillus phage 015DV002]|nr:hypothetical protein 015DV002_40 [Bacillus phage 015DV002]QQO41270.1 hypothetical protein 015DV004_54 [Bacillus phage 015DV004]
MENLYWNRLRKPPTYTKRQVESLKFLVDNFEIEDIFAMIFGTWEGNGNKELGKWTGDQFHSLNTVDRNDLIYTIVTGEYIVREETFEDYLKDRMAQLNALGEFNCAAEIESALEKYREFEREEAMAEAELADPYDEALL